MIYGNFLITSKAQEKETMQDLKPSFKFDFRAQLKAARRKLNRRVGTLPRQQFGDPAEECIYAPRRMSTTNESCGMDSLDVPRIAWLGLCAVGIIAAQSVLAGSIQQPGETSGIALGPPLPQGVYFVNFLNYGVRQSSPRVDTTVDIPILLWSTPWTPPA